MCLCSWQHWTCVVKDCLQLFVHNVSIYRDRNGGWLITFTPRLWAFVKRFDKHLAHISSLWDLLGTKSLVTSTMLVRLTEKHLGRRRLQNFQTHRQDIVMLASRPPWTVSTQRLNLTNNNQFAGTVHNYFDVVGKYARLLSRVGREDRYHSPYLWAKYEATASSWLA